MKSNEHKPDGIQAIQSRGSTPSYLVVRSALARPPTSVITLDLDRTPLLSYGEGPVHLGLSHCSLGVGCRTLAAMQAFELAIYVTDGTVELAMNGLKVRLSQGGFALVPSATFFRLLNPEGVSCRWIEASAPQVRTRSSWQDTVVDDAQVCGEQLVELGDLRLKGVGIFDQTMPAVNVFHADLKRAAQKMLIDRESGSAHLNMFIVEFEDQGLCNHHDHPFEEAYVVLEGTVNAIFEGNEYVLEAGDVAWCGVGSRHAFVASSGSRVRWLEFQTPQPPVREGMRWHSRWERLLSGLGR